MSFSGCARSALEHPLESDKVCCALSSCPLTAALSHWKVDVHYSPAQAAGVIYSNLGRKGGDKGATWPKQGVVVRET